MKKESEREREESKKGLKQCDLDKDLLLENNRKIKPNRCNHQLRELKTKQPKLFSRSFEISHFFDGAKKIELPK